MSVASLGEANGIGSSIPSVGARRLLDLTPAWLAAVYPFILQAFHAAVIWPESGPSVLRIGAAAIILTVAFGVPATGLAFAFRSAGVLRASAFQVRARRLAYVTVAVPTLYVFSGVVNSEFGRPLPQEWTWFGVWLAIGLWVGLGRETNMSRQAPAALGKLRVAHGLAATAILVFVIFHLVNHMFALAGPETHAAIMEAGRKVYRFPVAEVVLVALLLFQVISGLTFAWRWSALPADVFRVVQVASGVYLSFFILGHMNTIFLFARTELQIPTDWKFMTGEPVGLIHGSIHLVPHYALGVFFVLAHLVSGLRNVSIRRGLDRTIANRLWVGSLAGSFLIAAAIMSGLCGARIDVG